MLPGAHLNQEELAAAAGLSRTPVRLALLAMAREGLLAESTQGYRVIRLDVEEALDIFEMRQPWRVSSPESPPNERPRPR